MGALTDQSVYDKFSEHLLEGYVIEVGARAGQHLACDVAKGVLNSCIGQAEAKFGHVADPAMKLFFTCLEEKAKTEPAKWLAKLRKKMERITFQRIMRSGGVWDHSASERRLPAYQSTPYQSTPTSRAVFSSGGDPIYSSSCK